MGADPRHKPAEDAVREQMREEEDLMASSEPAPPADVPEAQEAERPEAEADEPEVEEQEDSASVLQRERDEYLALAQRTQADFENWRKRAARESAEAGRRAKSGLVGELLPVVDNLERALDSADPEDGLAGGVKLVHSELVSLLARNGVEPFDPRGEKFDPAYHEALSMRDDSDADEGTVVDVVEKGYCLGDSVLRPARVVVSG